MAYRLKTKDGSVEAAVRRIACEQIDKAVASIDELDRHAAVHDVRKRCKKLRGLVRLVRPAFDGYSDENARFRDTASLISAARDAKVMQDTYDMLVHIYRRQIDRRALGSIRRRFTLERKVEIAASGDGEGLSEARARLLEARERAARWQIAADGWDAIEGGLAKTYGRARKAAEEAVSCPGGEVVHELRKRIKYHWYHCRLLENLWPEMMHIRMHAAKELSDILGEHHDLTVFEDRLSANPPAYGQPCDVHAAIGLARARKSSLEDKAWPKVERLLAQSSHALAAHFAALWDVWQDREEDGVVGLKAA